MFFAVVVDLSNVRCSTVRQTEAEEVPSEVEVIDAREDFRKRNIVLRCMDIVDINLERNQHQR